MNQVISGDYRRLREDGGSKREWLSEGTDVTLVKDANEWGMVKIIVVATGKSGYFPAEKIGQGEIEPEPPPPTEEPTAPVVEITRVEGTVDGVPFSWQP